MWVLGNPVLAGVRHGIAGRLQALSAATIDQTLCRGHLLRKMNQKTMPLISHPVPPVARLAGRMPAACQA